MTEAILTFLTRESNLTEEQQRLLDVQSFRVRQLGDRVREMDRWKLDFRFRTGRAA